MERAAQPETSGPATGSLAGTVVARTDGVTEPPGQHRSEFARTFAEHSWARPGVGRLVARPHVVLLVATLAAVVASGAGVAVQLIWPVSWTRRPLTKAAGTAGAFTAVAGWDFRLSYHAEQWTRRRRPAGELVCGSGRAGP